ncbi:MAG: TraB domain-containing protein [Candidatus Nanoarchaeia archaeon]|jgi:pheromone shutdown-related protein TraB|nr:TraB domain-containing protein [Candidatus Nanoarchaeia archaeon]|tara:strand:- start:14449 stop:15111 length:663 start_codon:yes stop_codon:yes gene_type:complete
MGIYKNLIIIGTSHISIESVREVESVILKKRPEIVAIELDRLRFNSLMSKDRKISLRDITKIGFKGYLFNIIGAWIEKQLGKIVNVKPGSEMLKAIETGKKVDSKIALIDQDIRITLKRLSKELTWKEKFTFVKDIVKGIFSRKKIKIDLTKVPSKKLIKSLIEKLKKDYPNLHKVLIDERNIILAKNLNKLLSTNKTIVAVIGAGHTEEVLNLIKNENK